jgi:hypothetical protein
MNIEDYSEKSFVVLGETLPHKDNLKALGGKWNSRLRDGKKGWIYPMSRKSSVEEYISTGKVNPVFSSNSLKEEVDKLYKQYQLASQEIAELKKRVSKLEKKSHVVEEGDDKSDDEEPPRPHRRLIRRKSS